MKNSQYFEESNQSVKVISVRDNFHFVKEWFELANEDHFWIQWRARILQKMLMATSTSVEINYRGVDIGCGNSVLRKQIESFSKWNMDGFELDKYALSLSPGTRGQLFLYDIRDKHEEFHEVFDVLTMFDILEHYHDPEAFLKDAGYHLKKGGHCIINVPAIELLRSRYDEVAGHELRYSKRILARHLNAAGFRVVEMRYWGFTLILPLWIRRFVVSFYEDGGEVIKKGFEPPGKVIHFLLKQLGRIEASILTKPLMGTSIMVIAVKR